MAAPGSVIGWKVDRAERDELLRRFPPRYVEPVADHITLQTGSQHKPLPPQTQARIVGRADDGKGVEAMVVELDGSPNRPDGSIYHITWSLGPGRRAKESNDVLRDGGWTRFDKPVPVTVTPARF